MNYFIIFYFTKYFWGVIYGLKVSERDVKIFIIEKNFGNVSDGFKGNKIGRKETN